VLPNEEEDIAEKIKEMARSVRNESNDIFERPRRRLNTGDFIKSMMAPSWCPLFDHSYEVGSHSFTCHCIHL